MIGTQGGEPKVACPFHKKTFSLRTGECLNGDECAIKTYEVKVEGDKVFIGVVDPRP
jgi:nitrite reductase (NADH) small subunit